MTPTERTARQERYWGEEGQAVLSHGKVMILGADDLGIEIAKALAMIGIGNLLVGDDHAAPSRRIFIDEAFPPMRVYTSEALADSLRLFSGQSALNVEALKGGPSSRDKTYVSRLEGKENEVLVCASNDPAWQGFAAALAERRHVPLLLAACDDQHLTLRAAPRNRTLEDAVEAYQEKPQHRLLASLTAGLVAERVQQILFQEHVRDLAGVRLPRDPLDPPGSPPPPLLAEIVEGQYKPYLPFEFAFPQPVAPFPGDRHFLVFGAGAVINHTLKNLAPLVSGRITLVDYDTVDLTNLNRCELFWDAGQNDRKVDVLAEKIARLNKDVRVDKVYAFVGDRKDLPYSALKREDEEGRPIVSIGAEDLAKLRADIFVAGFDNMVAREYVNQLAITLNTPYIDGGSHIFSATVVPFIPGVTGCYECVTRVSQWAQRHRQRMAYEKRIRCQGLDASIDASNRVAGALEAYTILQALRAPGQAYHYKHDALRPDMPVARKRHPKRPDCPCPPIRL